MDWPAFDNEQFEMIKDRRFSEAEGKLVDLYEAARATGNEDSDLLEQTISRLAQFYSSPLTEDLERAKHFYDEREALFPSDYSSFQTALFLYYSLRDPQAALEKLAPITSRTQIDDAETSFAATALCGQCLLTLGELGGLSMLVQRLGTLIEKYPRQVIYGDAYNFVAELIRRGRREGAQLLHLLLYSPLPATTRAKFLALKSKLDECST